MTRHDITCPLTVCPLRQHSFDGSLHNYIDRFQGLAILWREIDATVHPEHRLVTQMIEQIEDLLYSGPCRSIKNWDNIKKTFCNATDTLRSHEIGQNDSQTKKAIEKR